MFQATDGDVAAGDQSAGMPEKYHFPSISEYRQWFTADSIGLEAPVMDRREEHALDEVDRIALAVEHLRDLLLAATRAELRAISKQQPASEARRN